MKPRQMLAMLFMNIAFDIISRRRPARAGKVCCSTSRHGAVCNDRTTSTATGPGTCSHHGGVRRWTNE